MALYVHAPLPGPFTVSKRIGGKRKRSGDIMGVVIALLILPFFVTLVMWWAVLAIALVLTFVGHIVAIALAPFPNRVRRFELARRPLKAPVMMWRGMARTASKINNL